VEVAQREAKAIEKEVAAEVARWKSYKKVTAMLQTLDEVWDGELPAGFICIASDVDVKKAYLKAVRLVHPDKLPPSAGVRLKIKAQLLFESIHAAWGDYAEGQWASQQADFGGAAAAAGRKTNVTSAPIPESIWASVDPGDGGRPYFYHRGTKEVRWELPGAAAPTAPTSQPKQAAKPANPASQPRPGKQRDDPEPRERRREKKEKKKPPDPTPPRQEVQHHCSLEQLFSS
jgi:hypothetical protein